MNIADIVGPVDIFSAAVAVGIGVGVTVIATTALARTPRRKLALDYELEKIRLANADADNARNADVNREVKLGQIAANRQVEIARIEGGMVDVKSARSNADG